MSSMWKFVSRTSLMHHFSDVKNSHETLTIPDDSFDGDISNIKGSKVAIVAPELSTEALNVVLEQIISSQKIQSLFIDWEDDNFPEALLKAKHLRHLAIVNHKLKTIPNSIESLRKLQTLLLHCTYLIGLPKGIAKLKKLETLDLLLLNTPSIPKQFAALQQLKTFILAVESLLVHRDWGHTYEYKCKWQMDREALLNLILNFEQLEQLSLSASYGELRDEKVDRLLPELEKLHRLAIVEVNREIIKPRAVE